MICHSYVEIEVLLTGGNCCQLVTIKWVVDNDTLTISGAGAIRDSCI